MSLIWGAPIFAMLDSLIQIFAAFYLHFANYKVLAYFGLVMALYDTIVVFSFHCQRKVFLVVLQVWQIFVLLFNVLLITQWFTYPLVVSLVKCQNNEGFIQSF